MSATEIFVANRTGEMVHAYDLRNAWGGGMAIWTSLAQRHLGGLDPYRGMLSGYQEVFDLLKTDRLARWEKIVLLTTCDGALVRAENFIETAEAMEKFAEEYKAMNEGKVFHPAAQAELLRKLHDEIEKEGWQAIGWNQTSVNGDCPWYGGYEEFPADDENEAGEERVPYNINKDTKHWWVFDDLKEPAAASG